MVPDGGFLKGFDAAYGVGSLLYRTENAAHALSLEGLHVSVGDQIGQRPADRIAGAVIDPYQLMLRGQELLIFVSAVFDFQLQVFVNGFIF